MSIIFVCFVAIVLMGAFSRFALSMVSVLAETKVNELVESALDEPDYYNCVVSTERMFEMRLVEAEIMGLEDMTVCEDYMCKNCEPSRDRIRAIQRAKQKDESDALKAARTLEEHLRNMLEAQSQPVSMLPRPPAGKGGGSPSLEAREKAFRELRRKQSAEARKSTAVVGGRLVPRPNNVPKRAEAFIQTVYGDPFIVWTWTLDGTHYGKPMMLRQEVTREVFNSFPLVAQPYAEGAIKELGELFNPVEKPRRAPRIGTETVKR